MLPNKPPYFYKCNSCGKTFNSSIKVNPLLEFFNIKKLGNIRLKCQVAEVEILNLPL
ncbi:hypothetical protein [uncultured Brachyspira sp.]|uniref:hypothetical protein n=1 Tax=uncultured Brachyspira sp. TaxID=221953 RepID=UPI00258860DF|nr:hypothetical protein [uncultured Brachyspira sp.]